MTFDPKEIRRRFDQYLNDETEKYFGGSPSYAEPPTEGPYESLMEAFEGALTGMKNSLAAILIFDHPQTKDQTILLDADVEPVSVMAFFAESVGPLMRELFSLDSIGGDVRHRHKGKVLVISRRHFSQLEALASTKLGSPSWGVKVIDLNKDI